MELTEGEVPKVPEPSVRECTPEQGECTQLSQVAETGLGDAATADRKLTERRRQQDQPGVGDRAIPHGELAEW